MWRASVALRALWQQQQLLQRYIPISITEMLRQLSGTERSISSSKRFAGRSLSGKLCTEADVQEEIIVTFLEQGEQHRKVCLLVCNFACSTWSAQQARLWFPCGALVSIEEPVLSFAANGTPCLEVLNPACVQIEGMAEEHDAAEEGRIALVQGEFIKAGHLLSSSCAADASRAWLSAGLLDMAISDGSRSVKDPNLSESERENALTSKGLALMRMQEFSSALSCFQELKSEQGRQLSDRCRVMLEQSKHGPNSVALEGYYMSREAGNSVPDCPDYVGSVCIGPAPYGKGRGLFATEALKAGDVIFTCNPLVSLCDDDKLPAEQDMVATLVRNCLCCQRNLQQLLRLVESHEIPDLGLLKPNSDWTASEIFNKRAVDIPACARKTSTDYGYKFERLVGKHRQREYLSGLWVLTAFANHSCEPNASQRSVGTVSLVRAGRDIQQGEEITLPYLNPLQPWDARSKQTRNRWGFDCACERCNFEKQLHSEDSELFAGVAEKMEQLSSDHDIYELSQMACSIEERLSGLSDKQKRWVRTSYYRAYEGHLLNRDEFEGLSRRSMDVSWWDLMEALQATASGHEGLLSILLAFSRLEHKANELIIRECVSCFGKLSPLALETILGFLQEDMEALSDD